MKSLRIEYIFILTICLGLSHGYVLSYLQNWAGCLPCEEGQCDYKHITFWYYNNEHRSGIKIELENVKNLPIIADAPWKILFHGLGCSRAYMPNPELRAAYFKRGKYNIICADNEQLLAAGYNFICYPVSADNTKLIGKCSAAFFSELIKLNVLPKPDKLHFVGHSLGAHIAGNTAAEMSHLGLGKIARITGLDPAGPLLDQEYTSSVKILDKDDAIFVDSHRTHTEGIFATGQDDRVGKVDILYNGGYQPGCYLDVACSHRKSVEYFAESIYPTPPRRRKFYAWKIADGSLAIIGEDMNQTLCGDYVITTNEYPPYAQGDLFALLKTKTPKSTPSFNEVLDKNL